MLPLSSIAILESTRIQTDSCWIVLLEIPLDAELEICVCNNNENIFWDGKSWIAFPFELEQVTESSKGEIPSVSVKVSNVTQQIQYYLEQLNGAMDFPVIIRVVNSKYLTGDPEIRLDFVCKSVKYDASWVTFALGGSQAITRRVPERRYLKDFCPFAYGGKECGIPYETWWAYPTCPKTLSGCRERGNSPRFGGEPAISYGGFYTSP